MDDQEIDRAIDEGADLLSRGERSRIRRMLAEFERVESEKQWERVKKMLVSYERSEWLWGKAISWTKAGFAFAAAAVAIKTLFGDTIKLVWQVIWSGKP